MRRFHIIGKKIIGVGLNYPCHVKEMGVATPKEPIFFLKPTTCYVLEPNPIRIPEVELGVVIGRGGANIKPEFAESHIGGYCIALDITARDLQREAKGAGLPWTVSKGFDTFCPISTYLCKNMILHPERVDMWLKVNGELRQKGNTRDMIFGIHEIISRISQTMRLEPGDFILTGTPAGVGPLKVGDTVVAGLGHDYVQMHYKVVPKPKTLRK